MKSSTLGSMQAAQRRRACAVRAGRTNILLEGGVCKKAGSRIEREREDYGDEMREREGLRGERE